MLKYIYRELGQMWYWYWVPFVVTPDDKLKIILENLELKKWDVFIDIGCWDGRVVEAIAKKFPTNKCIWYESSSYPYKKALERSCISSNNFKIYNIDIFKADISQADAIFIYMVPYMIPKLIQKIQSECRVGTKIFIQSHKAKSLAPEKIIPLSKNNNLYVYTLI